MKSTESFKPKDDPKCLLQIQVHPVYPYYEHKDRDKDDQIPYLIKDTVNVSCGHKHIYNRNKL